MRVLKDVNLNVVSAEVDTIGRNSMDRFNVTYHGEPLTGECALVVCVGGLVCAWLGQNSTPRGAPQRQQRELGGPGGIVGAGPARCVDASAPGAHHPPAGAEAGTDAPLPACLPACLSLPACLPASLCLPACLPASLCLPAPPCLPACLPAEPMCQLVMNALQYYLSQGEVEKEWSESY